MYDFPSHNCIESTLHQSRANRIAPWPSINHFYIRLRSDHQSKCKLCPRLMYKRRTQGCIHESQVLAPTSKEIYWGFKLIKKHSSAVTASESLILISYGKRRVQLSRIQVSYIYINHVQNFFCYWNKSL